jgi:hypothetical protein
VEENGRPHRSIHDAQENFQIEGAQKSGIQFKKGGVDIDAQTHINRLGNYVIDPDRMPVPLEQHLSLFL